MTSLFSGAELLRPGGIGGAELARALEACERITARDASSLYRVSQYFEDRARYEAFIAMYAVMRVVDDEVDAVDRTCATEATTGRLDAFLDAWEQRVRSAYERAQTSTEVDPTELRSAAPSELCAALAAAVATFPVPAVLWDDFFRAMRRDVHHARFADEEAFASYAVGATDAPTTIFLYLLTSKPRDGRYLVQDFDVHAAGSSLGRFAYLTHILRDVARDMNESLVYLSHATLASHDLDEGELRRMVALGRGDARWRSLVRQVAAEARALADAGDGATTEVRRRMPKDCAFILALIVDTYRELLRRLIAAPDLCLGTEAVLPDDEQRVLARRVAVRLLHWPRKRASLAAPAVTPEVP